MPSCPVCKLHWSGGEDLRPCNCENPAEARLELRRRKRVVYELALDIGENFDFEDKAFEDLSQYYPRLYADLVELRREVLEMRELEDRA